VVRAAVMVLIGLAGLVSLRVAYDLTREPAPAIRVRWRDGTTGLRRGWLEWKYRLVEPAAPEGLSYSYVLLDTSTGNIRALVKDPEVADTGDIDREKFDIPWATAQDSRRWMWVADRISVLRQPLARRTLVVAFLLMVAAGARRIVAAVRWRELARAARDRLHRLAMEHTHE